MIADILTKALHGTLFTEMRAALTGNHVRKISQNRFHVTPHEGVCSGNPDKSVYRIMFALNNKSDLAGSMKASSPVSSPALKGYFECSFLPFKPYLVCWSKLRTRLN